MTTSHQATQLHHLIHTHGGFTARIDRHHLTQATRGYAVAIPDHTLIVPATALTTETIAEYIHHNRMHLNRPGIHLGAWTEPTGDLWLDLTEIHPTRHTAITAAHTRGELAIYDLNHNHTIPTHHATAA